MYRVSTHPLPDAVRSDLVRTANLPWALFRLAVRLVMAMGAGVTVAFGGREAMHYFFPASLGQVFNCPLPKSRWEFLAQMGFVAVAVSSMHIVPAYKRLAEHAKLARQDLDIGACEQVEVVLPDRAILATGEEASLLLLPDGPAQVRAIRIPRPARDFRRATRGDCGTAWTWKRTKYSMRSWDFSVSGAPTKRLQRVSFAAIQKANLLDIFPTADESFDLSFDRLWQLAGGKPATPNWTAPDGRLSSLPPSMGIAAN